jgi:alanine-glyoxylate transaminase/serine-glyoxylate transaminase/serine-pyruvate transaminase
LRRAIRSREVHIMNPLNRPASGRHFLQIPGPTNVPDRVLRAIDMPTIDHRGPDFAALGKTVIAGMKKVFKTSGDVVIYPASGTGAWEAALVNTLSPGDRVLMAETGHFATLWNSLRAAGARRRIHSRRLAAWCRSRAIGKRLAADSAHAIKAVCVVHNETSTGVTSKVADVRAQSIASGIRRFSWSTRSARSPRSTTGTTNGGRCDRGGSQKGLMLPPGLSFNAIGAKALAAAKTAKLPRSYWDWQEMLAVNPAGFFPYTPATNLLYGLSAALDMLFEEGLDRVFARHDRLAEATRRAVRGWGLEILCVDPALYSSTLTAIVLPEGHNADAFRKIVLERFDMSLGQGLGKLSARSSASGTWATSTT